jgi:hypothetical protein
MQKAKGSWRSLVAAGLVSATLALPLSHAAAGQRQPYRPLSPSVPQEREEPSRAAEWLGVAFVVGLFYCVFTDCIGGGNAGGGAPRGREEENPQKPAYARPDSSEGCSWGDRLFGTCR